MNRNTLLEMSGRVMHMGARFTLNSVKDSHMMQEAHFDGMNSESRKRVERVQNYGFSSTPLPRDEQQQQGGQAQQGGGGTGGGGAAMKGLAAEGIAMFMGGQRNHPVIIGIDDRRHRPMGLKPGENAQYDDIGQMTLLRRTFTAILSLDSKDEKTGKMVERFVSLRHVEKKKQERPKSKQQSSGGSGSGGGGSGGDVAGPSLMAAQSGTGAQKSQSQKAEDYKHEGETVNTEIRCTKNRIEFRKGDKVMGYFDGSADKWNFNGKTAEMDFSGDFTRKADKILDRPQSRYELEEGANSKVEGEALDLSGKVFMKKASSDMEALASRQTIAALEQRVTELERRIRQLESR